jgi:hypothetical protein
MAPDKEPKIEHPAYQDENLEIKTEAEMEEAKKMAGVSKEREVLKRAEDFGTETRDYKLAQEAKEFQEGINVEDGDILRNVIFRKTEDNKYVAELKNCDPEHFRNKSIILIYSGTEELNITRKYNVRPKNIGVLKTLLGAFKKRPEFEVEIVD